MRKFFSFLRILVAAATLAVLALLAWQCVDIFRAGGLPADPDTNGAGLVPVFTREVVAARLAEILPFLAGYILLVGAALVIQAVLRNGRAAAPGRNRPRGNNWQVPAYADENSGTPVRAWRIALAAAAVAFIVLGVMNGGLWDVLVKAVNICTECIGLG